eukprot:s3918_g5.t1
MAIVAAAPTRVFHMVLHARKSAERSPSLRWKSSLLRQAPWAAVCFSSRSILKSVAEHLREKRVENRRLKAKNKKAKAKNDGEDVDVPETANTLKQLKSETGEALWDFEAADEFSDDQEDDTEEKHRELVVPDGNQVLAPEEGAETDSDDEAHMLSKHGHDLQVLLDRQKDPEDQDEDSQERPVQMQLDGLF